MMHELALYFAILTGTFIEGEATLIAAGFAAHREILNPFLVCLTAFVGAQGTDWFHFLLGRHLGARIIDKKPWLKLKLEKMNQYINKHPNSILFFFRFMYGTRTVLPIAIGISDIPIRKFAIYSVMGSLCWAITYTTLGYFTGHAMTVLFGEIKHLEWPIIITIILAGVIIFVIKKLRFRYRRLAG